MLKRVVTVEDLSAKDFQVSGGILRLRSGAFFFDASTVDFNPGSPLSGWVQPSNGSEGSVATVVFLKGTAYYKNIAGVWTLQTYDRDYFVPIVINEGETYHVPENTQVLYHELITVDGMLDLDGMLIFVGGGGDGIENCWWGNIYYDYSITGNIVLVQENLEVVDVVTWQFFDTGNWVDVQVGGANYDWSSGDGPGLYRVKMERPGFCERYSNIAEAYNL